MFQGVDKGTGKGWDRDASLHTDSVQPPGARGAGQQGEGRGKAAGGICTKGMGRCEARRRRQCLQTPAGRSGSRGGIWAGTAPAVWPKAISQRVPAAPGAAKSREEAHGRQHLVALAQMPCHPPLRMCRLKKGPTMPGTDRNHGHLQGN